MAHKKKKGGKKEPSRKRPSKKEMENSHEMVAEPRGGPWARILAGAEERTATQRPKDEDDAQEATPASRAGAEADSETPEIPGGFRRDRIREYRKRQKKALEERDDEPEPPSVAGRPRSRREAPEPVGPPPANNWIPIGPSVIRQGQVSNQASVSGRVAGIAVLSGGLTVFAATANGGVWLTEDAGRTWRSLMEAWDLNPTTASSDSLACGAIAVDFADPDRIYVGTGEGSSSVAGGGAINGVGPVRSDDGGVSWVTEPSTPTLEGTSFYALAMDPNDRERLVAATTIGLYRREPDGSGGYEWVRKRTGVHTSVVVARSGGVTTFYAATVNGQIFRSDDGDTWSTAGTGFTTASIYRVGLAVQPDNRDVVYALVSRGDNYKIRGVWRLDGATGAGGGTWRQVTGHPTDLFGPATDVYGQGWWDLAIVVDPGNINRIYLGGSYRDSGAAGADKYSGAMYRCLVSSTGSGSTLAYSMANTPIGANVHADIQTLALTPGDADNLWVGCDGGIFVTDNASGSADFEPRNTGLHTVTCEHLGLHPTEGAVAFVGAQDNGTVRYTGEEAWLHMAPGDGGFSVVNWDDPYKVLVTYPRSVVRRYTDGGQRYTYTNVIPNTGGDASLFYNPMVGTPPNPGTPAEADRVAIGTNRPWISDTFGGNWSSIPNGTTADRLGAGDGFRIRSMIFASGTRLYVGTMNGRVYRYDDGSTGWTRARIDDDGGLPGTFALPVTDIAVDPADASGDSVYVTFGGMANDYRRVWHYDGTQWQQRSGPAANDPASLLDVQFNAIVVNPDNSAHIYAGADIGVWRSTDGGVNWSTFSEGLPDAFVMDLKIVRLTTGLRLLRAATHGRSVYERTLDSVPKAGVELYVRDTQLDEARFTTVNYLPDPTAPGETVRHWRGPDIKLDTPDASGDYQFPLTGTIDFLEFVDELSDDSRNVATHATEDIITRVYVQVHNRGVLPANGVRVMCLLANASAALPALPAGYDVNVRNGTAISTANWETLGFATLDDVRVGAPKIAAFDLPSSLLPPPTGLAGNDHHCALALLHHEDDQYTSTVTQTDANSRQERKAAHKNLKVVEFTGTVPTAPRTIAVRINNPHLEKELLTRIVIKLFDYPGRVRVFIPKMQIREGLKKAIRGCEVGEDFKDFKAWAETHTEEVYRNQRGRRPYHGLWSKQRLKDIRSALETEVMLTATNSKQVEIRKILMAPGGYHTIFLLLDQPRESKFGMSWELEIDQISEERKELIGALTGRVDVVRPPKQLEYRLDLSVKLYRRKYWLIRASLFDGDGKKIGPEAGAEVRLSLRVGSRPAVDVGPMAWHRGWRTFSHTVPVWRKMTVIATALVRRRQVASAKQTLT